MGKWSGLRDKFPELPHNEALKAAVDELEHLGRQELTDEINALRDQKADLERRLKAVDFDLDAHEGALLREMASSRLESFVTGGYLWTQSEEPHPRVIDRTANVEWALEHDASILSVQWQSLKALVKYALENPGDPDLMPKGVEIYRKPILSRRKKA